MSKKIVIDATHDEETRVALIDEDGRLEDYDIESAARKLLKGNIFLAKVTRVEPSLQAAFVDYGGNRHGFLPFSEIHPDYYRIPIADKEKILQEEMELRRKLDEAAEAEEDGELDPEIAKKIVEEHTGEGASAPAKGKKQSKKDDEKAEAEEPSEDETQEAEAEEKPKRGRRKKVAAKKSDAKEVVDDEDVNGNVIEDDEENDANGNVKASEDEDDDNVGNVAESDDDNDGNHNKGRRSRFRGRRGRGRGGRNNNNRGGNNNNRQAASRRNQEVRDDEEFANPMQPLWNKIRRNYKIQEVIKRGQIMLIQINKEERGNKGAAVTSYITLPGRYCVLMPNSAQGGGVSRKINDRKDRRKMRDILKSLEVPDGMSVILRTAGLTRTKLEIKRDYTYLTRLWNSIRELTLKSSAPSLIHEEGNLLHRIIRDVYSKEFEEIAVAGENSFKEARNIMKMMMPSHAKRVVEYTDPTPLFIKHNVEKQIEAVHETTVQLKSGGYLVINPTEALVSVDVNSGRATRERHIEETALKTNLEAAEEVARQMRLRDLAGLVVIDFIDMENRKNNRLVERALQKALSKDRAKVQCGQISNFGLMELSRQRLRPSMTEKNFIECPHCHGKGIVRTVDGAALTILRAIENEGVEGATGKITVEAPSDVLLFLLNFKRAEMSALEERYGFSIVFDMDDEMGASDYNLESDKPKKQHHNQKNQRNQKQQNNRNQQQKGRHNNNNAKNDDKSDENGKDESNADNKQQNDHKQKGRRPAAKGKAPAKKDDNQPEAKEDKAATDVKSEDVKEEKPKRGRKKADAKTSTKSKTDAKEEKAADADKSKDEAKKKPTRGRKKASDDKDVVKTDDKADEKAESNKAPAKKAAPKKAASNENKDDAAAKKPAKKAEAKKDDKVVELAKPAEEPQKEPEYNVISKSEDGKKKKGWWSRMLEK